MRLRNQRGFTLIELVMIIVILGILAATAVIKYIDLQASAEEAACKGIYGSMVSAYGITIASVKRTPEIGEVNSILNGTPGDLTVNGSTTAILFNTTANTNYITGAQKTCSFPVTTDGSETGANANIASIGTLTVTPP